MHVWPLTLRIERRLVISSSLGGVDDKRGGGGGGGVVGDGEKCRTRKIGDPYIYIYIYASRF